jgi:uncharacterized protein
MDQNEKNKQFQKLKKSAEAGDAEAQYNLGQAFEYGEYDNVDFAEAMRWYKKAAQQGYVHAQFKLSIFYEDGMACEVDFKAAYLWAEKAALQGLIHAQKRVSAFLSLGKGVGRDLQKSAHWEKEFLIREGKEGSVAALYHLGNFLIQGRPGYPKDSQKAIACYAKSAQGGYKDAMLKLAGIYEKGIDTKRDEAAALSWYERAGYGEHPSATRLRRIIELRPACDKGDMNARYELGSLLGVDIDEGEAFLKAATSQGHRDAALLLFEFYTTADSGRSITPEQHKWIVKAGELGVAQAQHFLAMITNAREEKLSLLHKAADQGYQLAKDELGKLESAAEPEPADAEPDNMIARLKKLADAGDVVAKITLDSLLSSPMYSPEKK